MTPVVQPEPQIIGIVHRRIHHGRQRHGQHVERLPRSGDSDDTRACLQRRKRRHAACTRRMGRAGKDGQMPAAEFMRLDIAGGQGITPDKRMVFRNRACVIGKDAGGNADIEHLERPAKLPPRHEQMARLARHEGHRPFGPERGTKRHAPPAAETGGQIDGENRRLRIGHCLDYPCKLPRNIAGQSCPEDRVDHHVAGKRRVVAKRQRRHPAALESHPRIAPERTGVTEMMNHNDRATFHKRPRRHVTITAIVAAAAKHDETLRLRIVAKR
ncbi:hypothetical protein D3C71_1150070 [compost metagenome]